MRRRRVRSLAPAQEPQGFECARAYRKNPQRDRCCSRPAIVCALVQLTPLDPDYPSRLRYLASPQASLATSGGSLEAKHAVDVDCSPPAGPVARGLATTLPRPVVSADALVGSAV